jgi:hypothetical protein
MIVTKQKLLSFMVVVGMLAGSIFPYFHEVGNDTDNVSDLAIALVAQGVEQSHGHVDGHQSEEFHCETCHIFYHLYSNPYQLTILSPSGSVKHRITTDEFIGNGPYTIDKPPRFIG